MRLVRLKTRRQFLLLAKRGQKAVRKTLVLQSFPLSHADQVKAKAFAREPGHYDAVFVGFTASKKVGNAVARNRAKRRLTAAARTSLPNHAKSGQALVIIARGAAVDAPYEVIERDLVAAIKAVNK